jgi:hypothetical protein
MWRVQYILRDGMPAITKWCASEQAAVSTAQTLRRAHAVILIGPTGAVSWPIPTTNR